MFENYTRSKDFFISHPNIMITLEQFTSSIVRKAIIENMKEITRDYNEATYLHAFWANYPPNDRGRTPVGDQVPWIEVGEHSVGHKLNRHIAMEYEIQEVGLPSGADNRFVLISDEIAKITQGLTNRVFIFLDIKSVGPRDNFDHTVISPYQVSGDGIWISANDNVFNSTMQATGRSATHTFHPAIAPIYAFSNGTVAPTVHLFVKPIYKMLNLSFDGKHGQPLDIIKSICVPNGLLLTNNPNYLKMYPSLFFPGKDDKKKDAYKIRVRVSFEILRKIDEWRITECHAYYIQAALQVYVGYNLDVHFEPSSHLLH